MATFSSFSLPEDLVQALKKLGYVSPSPVQARVLPKALMGKSLVCQSETGSGKTHAYLIPILAKIDLNLPRTQALILAPSRELARQVYEFANAFTKYFPKLKVRLFSSEAERSQNKEGLSVPPHIAIATPGRAKDVLLGDEGIDLHGVRYFVIDEADMLMELGYFEDIDEIYAALPEKTATMVFSATLNQGLKDKIATYVGSDFLYEGEKHKTAASVQHHLLDIKHIGRFEALQKFLELRHPYLCIVFASKKEDVLKAYEFLRAHGYEATLFHGDLDARERKKALREVRENKYPIIVASDLLSRGIDIEGVTDVVSLDLPGDLAYYYHRAGRTGRFGKSGDSWVFYNADDVARAKALIAQGVAFDFCAFKGEGIVSDVGTLFQKKRPTRQNSQNPDERRDILIAKAKTRSDSVKPGYKVKQKKAVAKVKNKYRRKAIKEKVRQSAFGKKKKS